MIFCPNGIKLHFLQGRRCDGRVRGQYLIFHAIMPTYSSTMWNGPQRSQSLSAREGAGPAELGENAPNAIRLGVLEGARGGTDQSQVTRILDGSWLSRRGWI